MKAQYLILLLLVTFLFITCNNNNKELEVVDLTLEKTVIDTPPPPPPLDTNQLIKHFNEYVKIKPDSAVMVEAPKTKPSNADIFKDQAFLIINIRDENYIITFMNQTLPIDHLSDLDAFLQRNKSKINKDKVFVAGFTNSDKQKPFVKLLAKNGISKFRVNSN